MCREKPATIPSNCIGILYLGRAMENEVENLVIVKWSAVMLEDHLVVVVLHGDLVCFSVDSVLDELPNPAVTRPSLILFHHLEIIEYTLRCIFFETTSF